MVTSVRRTSPLVDNTTRSSTSISDLTVQFTNPLREVQRLVVFTFDDDVWYSVDITTVIRPSHSCSINRDVVVVKPLFDFSFKAVPFSFAGRSHSIASHSGHDSLEP